MDNDFQIKALDSQDFSELFTLDQPALAQLGALRMVVDKKPGFPCRVSLQDAEVGEEVILFSYQHHQTSSPYQASGAIFVRPHAETAILGINEIPKMLAHRLLSLRAYDGAGMMLEAAVVEGADLQAGIRRLFLRPTVAYLHVHNAKPGCYNCLVERA